MPYVNKPRPYKKEYQQQLARGENDSRNKRQQARREWDKKNGYSSRKGKDLHHVTPLSKGGSAKKSNVKLVSVNKNRSFKRKSNHKPA
tara:strand:- start:311 stop:574 length:264 start_codon:yes stop_codon:yes gene_type:complete